MITQISYLEKHFINCDITSGYRLSFEVEKIKTCIDMAHIVSKIYKKYYDLLDDKSRLKVKRWLDTAILIYEDLQLNSETAYEILKLVTRGAEEMEKHLTVKLDVNSRMALINVSSWLISGPIRQIRPSQLDGIKIVK